MGGVFQFTAPDVSNVLVGRLWFTEIRTSPGGDDEWGERSCVFGADQNNLEVSFLHFSGHLTPGAGYTKGRVYTVLTHGAFDAITMPHGDPHGHGDGWDAAEDVQEGKTETLPIFLGGYTGEAGTAPKSKTAFRHIITAVTYPRPPLIRFSGIHHRLRLPDDQLGRHDGV